MPNDSANIVRLYKRMVNSMTVALATRGVADMLLTNWSKWQQRTLKRESSSAFLLLSHSLVHAKALLILYTTLSAYLRTPQHHD